MKEKILQFIYYILRRYAKKVILRHTPVVLAITGSVGKTSTKEAIALVMKGSFGDQVRASAGNLNAEIGIPLTILGYTKLPAKIAWPFFLVDAWFRTLESKYPKYLILEMGVEHPGDIEYFGSIVTPDVGIITSASEAHIANFHNIGEMQAEKAKMAQIIKKDGLLIYNLDDQFLAELKFKNSISYSIKSDQADCRAANIVMSQEGMNFSVFYQKEKAEIKSRLIGEHLIYADLAAFCVGKHFKISSEKIVLSLEKRQPIAGRMNILSGRDQILIIDDTYNSNPASACAALKTLHSLKYTVGRKVAILGNMNELGDYEQEGHKKVGKFARGKCNLVIFAGPNATVMQEAYGDKKTSKVYPSRQKLIDDLDQIIQPADLVLVKASQNANYFEEIVKLLLPETAEHHKMLVRQEKHWKKKKRN